MLEIVISNQFKKDLKLAKKRGLKLDKLHEVVDTLAAKQVLEDKYRDHNLTGDDNVDNIDNIDDAEMPRCRDAGSMTGPALGPTAPRAPGP